MSFKLGDILHIVNGSDEEWWQAAVVDQNAVDGPLGLIPSKKRFVQCVCVCGLYMFSHVAWLTT